MSEWLDDDPALLDATLQLLEAWEPEPIPSSISSASSSPPPSPPKTKTKRKTNLSRERRKLEIQFLQKKSAELQHQLQELRDRRKAQLQPHFHDAERTQLATVAPVWENVAIRQFHMRKRAQVENAKLKTMLSAQLHVAQDLIRAIKMAKKRSQEVGPSTNPRSRIPIDISQALSEEQQLARLNVLCETWTREFARCEKFASGPRNPLQFLDMHVVDVSDDVIVIELFNSSVLPFSVARVEETMWAIYLDEGGVDDDGESFKQETQALDDRIIAVFTMTMKQNDGHRGAFNGKFVAKRLRPTPTQALLATHIQSEAQGFTNELEGVAKVEESWVRLIDAHELGHTDITGTLTVVQHVRRERIIVGKTNDEEPSPSRMAAVTQIIMHEIQEELNTLLGILEDVLMGVGTTK